MKTKLNEVYPIDYVLDSGNKKIFDFLYEYEELREFITEDNIKILNTDYYISHSADKGISPLAQKMLDNGETAERLSDLLSEMCHNRFGSKWVHLWDALNAEYNPLENYSMEEIRTPDLTTDETQNEKTDITVEKESEASNSYKGFNSDEPSLLSKSEGDETTTTTGAKADNEVSKKIEETGTETTTRSGNIGVTTSQQMLESELKVRQYDFYRTVFEDIDSLLCLSIY